MLITQTPLRVSLLSCDYPEHTSQHGGAFIGFAIDKFIYFNVRKTPEYSSHLTKLVYSETEVLRDNIDIKHQGIYHTIKFCNMLKTGLEIVHMCDVESRTGLGSSAAFIVGLINALLSLEGKRVRPDYLYKNAFFIERELMHVVTGVQDAVHPACGGMGLHVIKKDGAIDRHEVRLDWTQKMGLENHMMLFHTGIHRSASDVAKSFAGKTENTTLNKKMTELCYVAHEHVLARDYEALGRTVEDGWQFKRKLSDKISNKKIDEIHDTALDYGAWGVKICGAGSGGLILVLAPPGTHVAIKSALRPLVQIPFKICPFGSRVLFKDDSDV
jgi:D-glycero-alpha-D-manno-heptose-7-phosphate kinase